MPKLDHSFKPTEKVLILGANGQLGQAFVRALADASINSALSLSINDENQARRRLILTWQGPSQGGADLSSQAGLNALERYLLEHRPHVVINAAAYTAVDLAEQEREKAYQVNAIVPDLIARTLKQWQGFCIHFSTDYVFNPTPVVYLGTRQNKPEQSEQLVPYEQIVQSEQRVQCEPIVNCSELSDTQPINYYGVSKLAGEQALLQSGLDTLIVRTSWLYSISGQNFLTTMRRLMHTQEQLRVVDDQWGVPTSVDFVVRYTLALWQQGARGLFHVVPDGVCSWFEYAKTIAQLLKDKGDVLAVREIAPQSFQAYKAWIQEQSPKGNERVLADRPKLAVLGNRKLKHYLGQDVVIWQEELQRIIHQL